MIMKLMKSRANVIVALGYILQGATAMMPASDYGSDDAAPDNMPKGHPGRDATMEQLLELDQGDAAITAAANADPAGSSLVQASGDISHLRKQKIPKPVAVRPNVPSVTKPGRTPSASTESGKHDLLSHKPTRRRTQPKSGTVQDIINKIEDAKRSEDDVSGLSPQPSLLKPPTDAPHKTPGGTVGGPEETASLESSQGEGRLQPPTPRSHTGSDLSGHCTSSETSQGKSVMDYIKASNKAGKATEITLSDWNETNPSQEAKKNFNFALSGIIATSVVAGAVTTLELLCDDKNMAHGISAICVGLLVLIFVGWHFLRQKDNMDGYFVPALVTTMGLGVVGFGGVATLCLGEFSHDNIMTANTKLLLHEFITISFGLLVLMLFSLIFRKTENRLMQGVVGIGAACAVAATTVGAILLANSSLPDILTHFQTPTGMHLAFLITGSIAGLMLLGLLFCKAWAAVCTKQVVPNNDL